MSYYDSNSEDTSSWKHHSTVDTDYGSNFTPREYSRNDASSPAFNVLDADDDNNFATGDDDYDGAASAGNGNSYFHNSHHGLLDSTTNGNGTIAASAATGSNGNPVEEESQVVPASLDHLSRDELCRMIYRLDYERNTLQNQLADARRSHHQLNNNNNNRKNNSLGYLKHSKGKKRTRNVNDESSRRRSAPPRPTQPQELLEVPDRSMVIPTIPAAAATTTPKYRPPPEEEILKEHLSKVQKRLGQTLLTSIQQTAVHGLRKVPKTTIKSEITRAVIAAMMQTYENQQVSDSKRMTKWNFESIQQIVKLLKLPERLIHPVKHDGSGHILPRGSSVSNVYHWAKFQEVQVRYDKRDGMVTIMAKTVVVGCGRPENVPERARYSRGEATGDE